jgi:predicted MFS family arabinose efflux permease
MSNALGRLVGTLLSGWVFQAYGLEACLWVSSIFVLAAALISTGLPRHSEIAHQAN